MLQNINQPIQAILGFIAMVLVGIIAFFFAKPVPRTQGGHPEFKRCTACNRSPTKEI